MANYLAIINFVNLSTSNAIERSKEISLRKVLGAPKIYLIVQLLIESILITYLAIFLAILITGTVLPYFNQLMHTHLDIYLLLGVPLIGLYLLGGLVVGALAGIYPAFYIASFDSVIATRSGMLSQYSNKNNFFRKSLVVFQFAISTVLIFVTLVMFYQHKYLINKDLGFDSSELVMIPIRGTQVKKQIDVFKAEISKNPRILSASTISDVIGERTVYRGFEIEAQAEEKMLPFFYTDYDFAETFGIKMAAGRSFDENIRSDSMAYLINKQALVYFDFDSENALGKRMEDGNIIGVVEDFHATNLHEAITPLVIGIDPEWAAFLAVKVAPGNSQEVIQFLSNTWREFEQGKPFSPFFLNERLQTIYRNEAYTGKLVLGFTILGILVACFGLLGLINYATQARLKEIGIRKVMGGSVRSIYLLFAKNYLLLMVIAFGVALPVAFLLMQNWLREFPYRIALNLFYCAFPIGIVLLMVLSTISYHVIKAANTNPVKVLKDE